LTSQRVEDETFLPQTIENVIQYQQQEDSQQDEETDLQKAMNSTSETVCRSSLEAVYDDRNNDSRLTE
jgi:hypothetical protein